MARLPLSAWGLPPNHFHMDLGALRGPQRPVVEETGKLQTKKEETLTSTNPLPSPKEPFEYCLRNALTFSSALRAHGTLIPAESEHLGIHRAHGVGAGRPCLVPGEPARVGALIERRLSKHNCDVGTSPRFNLFAKRPLLEHPGILGECCELIHPNTPPPITHPKTRRMDSTRGVERSDSGGEMCWGSLQFHLHP